MPRAPLAVAALALALGLVLSTWARPSAAAPSVDRPATAQEASQTYSSDCAVCHGSDGRGTSRGITLVGQGRASTDYVLTTGRMPLALVGRPDEPAVAGRSVAALPAAGTGDPRATPHRRAPTYRPSLVAALVDEVAHRVGDGGPDVPVVGTGDGVAGGHQFRLQCAACHQWAGTGGALVNRAAPPVLQATPVQVAEAIRVGPGQMPAFGVAALTGQQVDDLAAYVQALQHKDDRGGDPLGHLGPVGEGALALAGLGAVLALCRWIGDRTGRTADER